MTKEEKLIAERARLETMKEYEHTYAACEYIAGVDEAGRGPLAGPVVAACCILPKNAEILYLNDSKKLSEKKREALFLQIKETAVAYGIGVADERRIDEINILQATYEAMRKAIEEAETMLGRPVDLLLNDAVTIPELERHQIPIIKGDAKSVSIAAASILAKVTRDHMMLDYDETYPEYGFAKHKGYGTKEHREKIIEHGPCPIHRRSFLKKILPVR